MKKATDALLSDHKMIRKLLESYRLDNPRFSEIAETVKRVVTTHAWFEDIVFIPALITKPLFVRKYFDELNREHRDLEYILGLISKAGHEPSLELEALLLQFNAIMENHLKKEEDALFPIAERVLDQEGMNKLSAEMERRQKEAAGL